MEPSSCSLQTTTSEPMTGRGLALVRRTAPDAETIYQLYVLDERRRLVGTLSLRELILNSPASSVRALMTTELVQAEVDLPQEEVARLISRYDLLALPV